MARGVLDDSQKPKAVGLVGDARSGSNQVRLHKAINRKLTDAAGRGGRGVLDVVRVQLNHMNGVNLATALHRIARRCVESEGECASPAAQQAINEVLSHPAFPALLEAVERQSAASLRVERREAEDAPMPAQCASIVAWSLAWLNLRQPKLFEVLGELASSCLEGFKPYEVTNMLWAYAKLEEWNLSLLRAVVRRLRDRQRWEFKAQCLCVAAWSLTKMKWRDEDLFQSMAEELSGQATLLKPQEISNTLWAYGKQQLAHSGLFEALGWSAFELVWQARFKPEELATCLSAFARVGIPHPKLFHNAMNVVIRRVQDFSPKQLATVLDAYARFPPGAGAAAAAASSAGEKGETSAAVKLLTVIACQIDAFPPEDLCSVAKSAAIWCPRHAQFWEACLKSARKRPQSFPPRAAVELSQALAAVEKVFPQESPAAVIQAIAEVRQELESLRSSDVLSGPDGAEDGSGDEPWFQDHDTPGRPSEVCKVDLWSGGSRAADAEPPARWTSGQQVFWSTSRPPGLEMIPTPAMPPAMPVRPVVSGGAEAVRRVLEMLPPSCLMEDEGRGAPERPLSAGSLQHKATGCPKWKPQPLWLRHGRFNERVVLRPLEPGTPLPSPRNSSPYLLQPLVAVAEVPLEGFDVRSSRCYLAYPFCQYGNLMEYVMTQKAMQMQLSARHAALIAKEVLLGVEALIEESEQPFAQAVSSVMPTKIFIDRNGAAKVLAPVVTGRPQSWRRMAMTMKWMSPEEVQDEPVDESNVWQVITYRIGLLLYCLGVQDAGLGDMVPHFIQDSGGRVDMAQYQQVGLLRCIVEECLRLGELSVPPREILMSALDAIILG